MHNPLIISTAIYDGYRFEDAFKSLAGLGINYVELAFIGGYTEAFSEDYFCEQNADMLIQQLAHHNLRCPSFSSHVDLSSDGIVQVFKRRMNFARSIGADTIITNAAPADKADIFYRNISELADHAAKIDLMIGLENPGDGLTSVLNQGSAAADVIKRIGAKWVGINYDFGNLLSHCFEKVRPEEDYKACQHHIVHYHIKDVQQDNHGWYFPEIGKGSIDYQTILKEISCEPRPKPICLEIPLRLRRDRNAQPVRQKERVDLTRIETILQKSISFVLQAAELVHTAKKN